MLAVFPYQGELILSRAQWGVHTGQPYCEPLHGDHQAARPGSSRGRPPVEAERGNHRAEV